jgi:hypothetical protein
VNGRGVNGRGMTVDWKFETDEYSKNHNPGQL